MGTLAVYLTAKADGLERGLNKGVKALKGFASMALAAFGVNSLKNFAEESLNLFGIQEQNEKRLEAVLKATNYAAGLGAKELKNYASELQGMTTVGDEEILKMQTTLLAFTGVAGNEFKRATALALDMSEVLGTGATENIKKLGKSLDDPKSALTGLMETGIFFTEEQKKQITQLVDAGKKREAQLVILAELERHYGGAATAATDTVLGRQKQMTNAWGDLREEIGRVLAMVISVQDNSKSLADTFSNWAAALKKDSAEIVYTLKSFWIDFSSGLKLFWELIEPIAVTLGSILSKSMNNWAEIFTWIYYSAQNVFKNIGKAIGKFFDAISHDLINFLMPIPNLVKKTIEAITTGNQDILWDAMFPFREAYGQFFSDLQLLPFPKLQDFNTLSEIFSPFGKIGSEWDRIERERYNAQANLEKWYNSQINPKPENGNDGGNNGGNGNGNNSAGIIVQNVAKLTNTALRGSLEAYQARYNTGKDFENKLVKLQEDQLTETKNQTAAIESLAKNGIALGVANM